MRPRRALAVAAVSLSILCPVIPGAAQNWTASSSERPKVEVAPAAPVRVQAGKDSTVTLNFRVRPQYHINSNAPKSDWLIPTVLKLSPPTNITIGGTDYPEGKDMTLAFAPGQPLNVYSGDFALNTRVIAGRNLRPGKYRVRGELKYQACDVRACYPPTELPVMFDVAVARPTSGRTRRNPAQSPHAR